MRIFFLLAIMGSGYVCGQSGSGQEGEETNPLIQLFPVSCDESDDSLELSSEGSLTGLPQGNNACQPVVMVVSPTQLPAEGVVESETVTVKPIRSRDRALRYLKDSLAAGVPAAAYSLSDSIFARHEPGNDPINIHMFASFTDICQFLSNPSLTEETWVVCDIDYSFVRPTDPLGRAKGQLVCQSIISSDLQWTDLEDKRRLVELLMRKMPYELIDEQAPQLLEDLKIRGIPVIGLTRMALDMKKSDALDWRLEQLRQLGLCFDAQLPAIGRVDWENSCSYKDGVIRAGKNTKGTALSLFINQVKLRKPRSIIFMDNNFFYLHSVREMCKEFGIQFCGLHFLDPQMKEDAMPNPYVIRYQLHQLFSAENLVPYDRAMDIIAIADRNNIAPSFVCESLPLTNKRLSQAWVNTLCYHSEEERAILLTEAEEGNSIAQAYAALLYQAGLGGLARNSREGRLLARKCARELKKTPSFNAQCAWAMLRKYDCISSSLDGGSPQDKNTQKGQGQAECQVVG